LNDGKFIPPQAHTFKLIFLAPKYETLEGLGVSRSKFARTRGWEQRKLPIVRLQRLSLNDYPGRLCAKAVIPGCNFRCPYCNKRELIFDYLSMDRVPERDVLDHLYRVKGYLTGLCIGGGEPTLHYGLLQFAYKVKSLGYKVKLDTNGTRPRRLRKMMEEGVLDYVAMDIKAPLDRYPEVVRYKVDVKAIEESIKLLRKGGIDHEFSTTVVPGIIEAKDIEEIARTLIGSKRFVIQQLKFGVNSCPEYSEIKPYTKSELEGFRQLVLPYFADCKIKY
jgi:pyruvate formate lyase activating enzyme